MDRPPINNQHLQKIHGQKILVIGDLMLDRFIQGPVERLSPEAPVPIIKTSSIVLIPGGGANVAANLRSLGGKVTLFGAIGNDLHGRQLLTKIQAARLSVNHIIKLNNYVTTTKTRVIGNKQHLTRIDDEITLKLPEKIELEIIEKIKIAINDCNAVAIADYGKGFLSKKIAATVIDIAQQKNIPVIVDTKPYSINWYQGVSLLTPNQSEAFAMANTSDIKQAGITLKNQLASNILITQGQQGLTLFEQTGQEFHLPSFAKSVMDVSGAGDTIVAGCALGLAARLPLKETVTIANIAAAISVSKFGTSQVTQNEIADFLNHSSNNNLGIITLPQLLKEIKKARQRGEKIVMTNGCFDILSVGHIDCLQQARQLGDRLIVAINSDESVKNIKGSNRPYNNLKRRMLALAGLHAVDWVISFNENSPRELIKKISPDILAKGGDWQPEKLSSYQHITSYGGQVIAIKQPVDIESHNADLINRIKNE